MHDPDALRLAERAALNVALRAALLCYLHGADNGEIDGLAVNVSREGGEVFIDITETHGDQPVAGYSL